jgi:sec-independent protein translocase protein TatB
MMPGIGFEEMILLVLVAIVVIGPKDLPLMMRKFGRFTGKMRAMAFEFKQGFDELGRQAELEELRKEVADLKNSTGLGDLRREFEEDQRALEADVNSALAATDPTPAQPAAPAVTTPAVAGAAAVAAVATTGEAAAATAPVEAAPVIPAPGMGENGLPLVKAQDRFPKPVRKQPTPRPAAEPAPYSGLSADHPGYDAGEDFRIDGGQAAPQPAVDAPANGQPVNGEAAGDVHVIPDDHVRPAHPAARLAAKQDTPA